MRYTRRRRYGETHIGARLRQIDELLARIAGYAEELARAARRPRRLCRRRACGSTPISPSALLPNLAADRSVRSPSSAARAARRGRRSRPCRACPVDTGTMPEPVAHELLEL